MRVNIIGAGLAGTALAYILKQKGAEPVIYEAFSDIASGASGNEVGLYNPRFAAQMDRESKFFSKAFFLALKVFEEFGEEVNWTPCGVMSLLHSDRKIAQLSKTASSWGWKEDYMQLCSAQQASDIAGVEIGCQTLFLPKSGNISPKKLCDRYARDIEVHLNCKVTDLSKLKGDITILACGIGVKDFEVAADLPLKAVRGQVSYIAQSEVSRDLKTVLSYSGYIAPAKEGVHVLGATFQPWFSHSNLIEKDNITNLEMLFNALPALKSDYEIVGNRAGVRTASKDHFPVVGQLAENIYISSAHGSHGILTSLLSAEILSDKIISGSYNLDEDVLNALSPERFS